MFDKIEDKISRIEEFDKGKSRKKIAILGAGMAGLVAAYELSRLGHSVEIFEASDRVGGRVWTKRFADGQYHELGAMRIPQTHDHTRYYANLCGLKFRRFINNHDDPNAFYFLRGIETTHREFLIKLIPELNLTDAEKEIVKVHPLELFGIPLNNVIKEIRSNKDHLKALFAEGPLTNKIMALEKLSLGDFFKGFLSSQDSLDFIGGITGLEVWWNMAVTMFIRDEISQQLPDGSDGKLEEIIGGTDLLPTNLSNIIKAPIHLKHEIVSS
jgi:monoamine oxidase